MAYFAMRHVSIVVEGEGVKGVEGNQTGMVRGVMVAFEVLSRYHGCM